MRIGRGDAGRAPCRAANGHLAEGAQSPACTAIRIGHRFL